MEKWKDTEMGSFIIKYGNYILIYPVIAILPNVRRNAHFKPVQAL